MRHRSPLAAGVATRSLKATAPDTAPGARSPGLPSAREKSNDAPAPALAFVAFTMVMTSSGRMYPLRTSMVSPTLVRVATMGGKSVSAVVFRMRTGSTSSALSGVEPARVENDAERDRARGEQDDRERAVRED